MSSSDEMIRSAPDEPKEFPGTVSVKWKRSEEGFILFFASLLLITGTIALFVAKDTLSYGGSLGLLAVVGSAVIGAFALIGAAGLIWYLAHWRKYQAKSEVDLLRGQLYSLTDHNVALARRVIAHYGSHEAFPCSDTGLQFPCMSARPTKDRNVFRVEPGQVVHSYCPGAAATSLEAVLAIG